MLASFFERRKPVPAPIAAILPLAYLIGVFWMDHFISGPPVTPALCCFGVMLMALFFSTAWVVFWVILYSIAVWGLCHSSALYYFASQSRELPMQIGLNIRALSFSCVGVFSVTFSYLSNSHRKSLRELREVLSKFPEPIVISDFSGAIIDCNERVTDQLGVPKDQIRRLSYFDCFSAPEFKGRTIAKYLALFEGNERKADFKLCIGNHNYVGETLMLESSGSRLLLTVFKSPGLKPCEETPCHQ